MCFTTALQKTASELDKRFQRRLDSELQASYQPQQSIVGFTFPNTPVIVNSSPQLITSASWGLLPVWAKDESFRKNLLNAKIETLETLPSFKQSVQNRCLVIADAFYEWKWLDPKGKNKQKYKIGVEGNDAFAMAGIYSVWQNKQSGQVVCTYSIITTEANELMSEIHNTKKRMPIVLTKDNEEEWLAGEQLSLFVQPAITLIAEAVS